MLDAKDYEEDDVGDDDVEDDAVEAQGEEMWMTAYEWPQPRMTIYW